MSKRTLVLVLSLLVARTAAAAPLPPPSPPPDPQQGDRYDGRRDPYEPVARQVALAVPRGVLWIPRGAWRLIRYPVLWAATLRDERASTGVNLAVARHRGHRIGIRPATHIDFQIAAVGARVWDYDLLGYGNIIGHALVIGGYPLYGQTILRLETNPAFQLGGSLDASALFRNNTPFYGLAGNVPSQGSASSLEEKINVRTADGALTFIARPRGAAGRWRARVIGGVGARDLVNDADVSTMFAPGNGNSFGLVSGGLAIDRLSLFDRSRGGIGIDATARADETWSYSGYDSQFTTMSLTGSMRAMVGHTRQITLRGLVADQISHGSQPIDWYDTLGLGGDLWHRAFAINRFHGKSAAILSLDYDTGVFDWLDAFAFVECGNTFQQNFDSASFGALRTSLGVGARLYGWRHFAARLIVGWGIGDGARVALSFEQGP
jgi:hypothetical protein